MRILDLALLMGIGLVGHHARATPEIVTASLPQGMEMVPYSAQLVATNGVEPFTWSVAPPVVAWGRNDSGQATIPGNLTEVEAIAGGIYHSLALKSDGTVVEWGGNWPSVPWGLTSVEAIAAGGYHSLAIKYDGTVVAWGSNWDGQTTVPGGLAGVKAIAGGGSHSLALNSDGTLVAWGRNDYGQGAVPAGLAGVEAIAAGTYHNLVLKSDGTVITWGNNGPSVPVGLTGVVAIAAGGGHNLVLKSNGTVVAWGANEYGQTDVPAGLSGVVAIAAGHAHNLALRSDGSLVVWGRNDYGQRTVPMGLTGVKAIAAGGDHSLVLKSAHTQLPEGLSLSPEGRLSGTPILAGTNTTRFVVEDNSGDKAWKDLGIVIAKNANTRPEIDATSPAQGVVGMNEGSSRTYSVTAHDPEGVPLTYAWTWNGQPVGGNTADYTHTAAWGDVGKFELRCRVSDDFWENIVSVPWRVKVANLPLEFTPSSLPPGREMVPYSIQLQARNGVEPYAWNAMPHLAGWGSNWYGQTTVPSGSPGVVAIAAGVDHSLALKSDGTMVAWGFNGSGQATVPVGLAGVAAIAAGLNHSLALKSDGTVVAWGSNWYGQTTVPSALPGVVAIAAGNEHSLALKSDGTVAAWGFNASGQTTVPGDLAGVVAIAAGSYHSLALKSDGTVVAWGDNSYRQTTLPGGVSGVVAIAAGYHHSLALRSAMSKLPVGLSLSPGGMLSGVPVEAATNTVMFAVRDSLGEQAYKELVLFIQEAASSGPDADGDGLPDWWETLHFGGPTNANSAASAAGGRHTIGQAYVADVDPADPDGVFQWTAVTNSPAGAITLVIDPTSTARVYSVHATANLAAANPLWTPIPPEKAGTGSAVTFTIPNHTSNRVYRAGVRLP